MIQIKEALLAGPELLNQERANALRNRHALRAEVEFEHASGQVAGVKYYPNKAST